MIGRTPWPVRLGIAMALGVAAVICVGPLAAFVAAAFSQEGGATVESGFDSRQLSLLANSLTIAVATTFLALAMGVPAGFLLCRADLPLRRSLAALCATSFLIPPYVAAMAWIDLAGNSGILREALEAFSPAGPALPPIYSITGASLVTACSTYPLVAFSTWFAARRVDASLLEASRLAHGPWATFTRVTLPMTSPGILTGALAAFLSALLSFSVPSLLQVDVYIVEIYTRFSAFYDIRGAAMASLPLVLLGVASIAAWQFAVVPRWRLLAATPRRHNALLTRGTIAGLAYLIPLGLVTAGMPVAILLTRVRPYDRLWGDLELAAPEILTSLFIGSCTATFVSILGFTLAIAVRGRAWASQLVGATALPFLVSGPIMGIGLIRLWDRPGLAGEWVYDTLCVAVLACAGMYLFVGYFAGRWALREIPQAHEEAAAVAGAGRVRRVAGVIVPQIAYALAGIWGLVFVLAVRDLDTVLLVTPPGYTTLSVRLFTLMHYGPDRTVAALSLITVALTLGVAALAFGCVRVLRRPISIHD